MSMSGSSHKKSGKCRYITISDNVEEHWPALIEIAKGYEFYAYIFHEPDHEDSKRHLHLLCMSHNPMVIQTHAQKWESVIPSNMVCVVVSPKRMARYLCHLDSPEKIKYDISMVQTNSVDHYRTLISTEFKPDTICMFEDYVLLKTHQMSARDFLDKYRSDISELGIYQRIVIYDKIYSCCVSSDFPDIRSKQVSSLVSDFHGHDPRRQLVGSEGRDHDGANHCCPPQPIS